MFLPNFFEDKRGYICFVDFVFYSKFLLGVFNDFYIKIIISKVG